MTIPKGDKKRIYYPLKNNDQEILGGGQIGVKYRGAGAEPVEEFWAKAPRELQSDPESEPFRLARVDEINAFFGAVPSGSVNDSNVTFTVPWYTVDISTSGLFFNGIRLTPLVDYTIVSATGSDLTTITTLVVLAPDSETGEYDIWFESGSRTLGGVSSFNGQSGPITYDPLQATYEHGTIGSALGDIDCTLLTGVTSSTSTDPVSSLLKLSDNNFLKMLDGDNRSYRFLINGAVLDSSDSPAANSKQYSGEVNLRLGDGFSFDNGWITEQDNTLNGVAFSEPTITLDTSGNVIVTVEHTATTTGQCDIMWRCQLIGVATDSTRVES